jgi:polysaccharide pyruvyl transferase WcaK-like protein
LKKVFLITKLKTSNIGNEALSYEIIKLFKDVAKEAIINVNGRPFGLDGYLPSRLLKVNDPINEFEKWTDKIVKKIKAEPNVEFEANDGKVILYQQKTDYKVDKWKSKLRPIKRFINSLFVYSNEYKKRASILKASNWLIYSGAGEVTDGYRGDFNDAHVFLRQMIEIRVAQKLGINTAAVNQSIFVNQALSQKIIAHVYKNMKKIIIRGTSSRDALINYGVPADIIEMAPDSAINTHFENAGKVVKDKNIVGLNFSNHVKINEEQMGEILDYLTSIGKKVYYCTNEPIGDYALIETLSNKFNLPILDGFNNYNEYAQKLSEFDFVISARVHTNMLSMISHTTVIPIEGNDFRLHELLEGFQYPLMPVKSQENGWVNRLIQNIESVRSGKYNFEEYFEQVFSVHKKKSIKNADWINDY